MSVKVIAIGNILMGDDGVGIAVARNIKYELECRGIKVIIGETDYEYCISLINEEDFIFVLDAAYYDKNPGEITFLPIDSFRHSKQVYTQHSFGVLDLVDLYYKSIRGYIIGVEVSKVHLCCGLSNVLESNLKSISLNIMDGISNILKNESLVFK